MIITYTLARSKHEVARIKFEAHQCKICQQNKIPTISSAARHSWPLTSSRLGWVMLRVLCKALLSSHLSKFIPCWKYNKRRLVVMNSSCHQASISFKLITSFKWIHLEMQTTCKITIHFSIICRSLKKDPLLW